MNSSARSVVPVSRVAHLLRTGLLALSLGLMGSVSSGLGDRATVLARPLPPATAIAQIPVGAKILYVNPVLGSDAVGAGTSEAVPFKTLTYALLQAKPGNVVQLARGTYIADNGENFPILVPAGVIVRGEDADKGKNVSILGSGKSNTRLLGAQNITLRLGADSVLQGVNVTNVSSRGTGVWVEAGSGTIQNCSFTQNNREGIFVAGNANVTITGNVFTANGGQGVSIDETATGNVRNNLFQDGGFGLAIGGSAAPVIADNTIVRNVSGLYLNKSAKPILRNNVIENNKENGLVATGDALPDLGSISSPGGNTFRANGKLDINNSTTSQTFVAYGNTLDSKKVAGKIDLSGTIASGGGSTGGGSTGGGTTGGGTTGGGTTGGGTAIFADAVGHWAQPYIEALGKQQIITGFPDGTFRPSEPVTRVQFAAILTKAFALTPKNPATPFSDVPSSFWGYGAIQSAAGAGFMKGYPDGEFKPGQRIPRVQSLVALANGLGFPAGEAAVLTRFQDSAQIPNWATGSISAATTRKIVVNYPLVNQLNPNREATRAEVAAFVYQALANAGRLPAVPSQYVP